MGIRKTIHVKGDRILISIDLRNAYNIMWISAVLGRHRGHMTLRRAVPYWMVKLGPRAPIWAEEETIWRDDGLQQGPPLQVRHLPLPYNLAWVREADKKVEAVGGCTRFGMDDGYMVGPREVIFGVLEDFAKGIREGTGCELMARKCKFSSMYENAWEDCNKRGLIPRELEDMEEGINVNESGDRLRGVTIFNVPVGEQAYVEAILRHKAQEVTRVTRKYVSDLKEDHPQKMWTML